MAGRLEGKVAIITGATSGIGEGTAERFVAEGARVVMTGRSEEKGKAIAARLGKNAVFYKGDVTREADLAGMVAAAKEKFGRLDCLFNNAGFSTAAFEVEKITEEAFLHDMMLLVGSVVLGIKHAAPLLRASGGGSIINNASIAGMATGYGPPVYCAAKAAVIHLTRTMAMELAKDKIRVNAISPGVIQTAIFERALGADLAPALGAHAPQGRAGTSEEVARAAVYLASEESSYVTGHNLVVDGGMTIGLSMEEMGRRMGM